MSNKLTKKDVSTTALSLTGPAEAAAKQISEALATAGRLIGTESREDGSLAVRGMVTVGLGGLKPVVITAIVTAGPAGISHVNLRAAGREALVKQHPADKGLAKITALLTGNAA
jgi:hypothetical protein